MTPSAVRFAGQAIVIAACVCGSALYAGTHGVVSAVIGGAIVTLIVVLTPLVLRPVLKYGPMASLPIALGLFVTKIIVLAALLIVLTDDAVLGATIDNISLGVTMGISAFSWSILMVIAAYRTRTPIYDLDEPDDNGGW